MNSRELNRQIEYWVTGTTNDGFGGELATEELLDTTWAKIEALSDRAIKRYTDIGISDLESGVTMIVRRRTDINQHADNIFIKFQGDRYSIRGLSDPDIEKSFLKVLAIKQMVTETIPPAGGGGGGFPFTFT